MPRRGEHSLTGLFLVESISHIKEGRQLEQMGFTCEKLLLSQLGCYSMIVPKGLQREAKVLSLLPATTCLTILASYKKIQAGKKRKSLPRGSPSMSASKGRFLLFFALSFEESAFPVPTEGPDVCTSTQIFQATCVHHNGSRLCGILPFFLPWEFVIVPQCYSSILHPQFTEPFVSFTLSGHLYPLLKNIKLLL